MIRNDRPTKQTGGRAVVLAETFFFLFVTALYGRTDHGASATESETERGAERSGCYRFVCAVSARPAHPPHPPKLRGGRASEQARHGHNTSVIPYPFRSLWLLLLLLREHRSLCSPNRHHRAEIRCGLCCPSFVTAEYIHPARGDGSGKRFLTVVRMLFQAPSL